MTSASFERAYTPIHQNTTNLALLPLIEEAARRLTEAKVSFGHGTDNAFDEAAWLVLWSLELPLNTDLNALRFSTPLNQAAVKKAFELIEKRIQTRKPAAYLTQQAWLHNISFYIDERAIVPRSLIAELIVDGSIDLWLSDKTKQVLDLCTGNGSLAILAALAWPEIQVDALDISSAALEVCAINIAQHKMQNRIRLVQSDALSALNACDSSYDLIICNPPYVNSHSMSTLPAEYLAEPELALAGGKDGMDFIKPLLEKVAKYMREKAVLILEIGHERVFFETAFAGLHVTWLETSSGCEQVLLIEREDLVHWQQKNNAHASTKS